MSRSGDGGVLAVSLLSAILHLTVLRSCVRACVQCPECCETVAVLTSFGAITRAVIRSRAEQCLALAVIVQVLPPIISGWALRVLVRRGCCGQLCD